jgi:hypothetical protein
MCSIQYSLYSDSNVYHFHVMYNTTESTLRYCMFVVCIIGYIWDFLKFSEI